MQTGGEEGRGTQNVLGSGSEGWSPGTLVTCQAGVLQCGGSGDRHIQAHQQMRDLETQAC